MPTQGDPFFPRLLVLIGVLAFLYFRFKLIGSAKASSDQSDYGLRQELPPDRHYDLDGSGDSDGDMGGI